MWPNKRDSFRRTTSFDAEPADRTYESSARNYIWWMYFFGLVFFLILLVTLILSIITFSSYGRFLKIITETEAQLQTGREVCAAVPDDEFTLANQKCGSNDTCTVDLICSFVENRHWLDYFLESTPPGDDNYDTASEYVWCKKYNSLNEIGCQDLCITNTTGTCSSGICTGSCKGDCETNETCSPVVFVEEVFQLLDMANGMANYTSTCFFGTCVHVLTLEGNTTLESACNILSSNDMGFSSEDWQSSLCLDIVDEAAFPQKKCLQAELICSDTAARCLYKFACSTFGGLQVQNPL